MLRINSIKTNTIVVVLLTLSMLFACAEASLTDDDTTDASRLTSITDGGVIYDGSGRVGDSALNNQPDGTPIEQDSGPREPVIIPIPNDLGDQISNAVCDYLARCQFKEFMEHIVSEPCEQVIARQYREQTVQRLSPLVQSRSIVYDPLALTTCLQAFQQLACDINFSALTETCRGAFIGQVSPSGNCTEHEECTGEHYCVVSDACPGRCAPQINGGEVCATTSDCRLGLDCIGNICTEKSDVGGNCGGTGPLCRGGLYCTGENNAPGRCATLDTMLAQEGARCDVTAGPLCSAGLACVVVIAGFNYHFECKALQGEGQRCYAGFPDQCQAGLYCEGTNPQAQDVDGRCRARPMTGQACGQGAAFKVCAEGLVCDGNLCKPRGFINDPCTQNETCYSGQCQNGTCASNALCAP